MQKRFSRQEIFSLILSAAVHDVGHIGYNNDYLVKTRKSSSSGRAAWQQLVAIVRGSTSMNEMSGTCIPLWSRLWCFRALASACYSLLMDIPIIKTPRIPKKCTCDKDMYLQHWVSAAVFKLFVLAWLEKSELWCVGPLCKQESVPCVFVGCLASPWWWDFGMFISLLPMSICNCLSLLL